MYVQKSGFTHIYAEKGTQKGKQKNRKMQEKRNIAIVKYKNTNIKKCKVEI